MPDRLLVSICTRCGTVRDDLSADEVWNFAHDCQPRPVDRTPITQSRERWYARAREAQLRRVGSNPLLDVEASHA